MQIAVISPTAGLWRYSALGDIEMALTHIVLSDEHYRKYFREARAAERFIILDNGLFELKEAMPIKDVIEAARMIGASELICRDVLYDGKATVEASLEFIRKVQESGLRARLMAVPQGKTDTEWFECAEALAKLPSVSCLGISKLSVPKCFPAADIGRSRIACLSDARWGTFEQHPQELHLLGGHDDLLWELKQYDQHADGSSAPYAGGCYRLRSNDSSVAVWRGAFGLSMNSWTGKGVKTNAWREEVYVSDSASVKADTVDFGIPSFEDFDRFASERINANIAAWHAVSKAIA